jgi:hypothetical protein
VEATTGCRVYIRGKGSIKDPDKVVLTYTLLLTLVLLKSVFFFPVMNDDTAKTD